MDLIIIFGPPAVGKMTVGHALSKCTGYKLFHNHMTIDLVLNFFDYGQPQFGKLVNEFRNRIFEEVATSQIKGIIFTYVWALNQDSDRKYIDKVLKIFQVHGASVYFVELEADLDERLLRNESDYRLSMKPSKRDVTHTRKKLLEHEKIYKMNSKDDFYYKENYMKINNTQLSADQVAIQISQHFKFSGA
jgi:hypothetical protein